jgi:hypothetical protein
MAHSEFNKFDSLATKLLRVPHSEIKAKLEAEKAERAEKPKRKQKSAQK